MVSYAVTGEIFTRETFENFENFGQIRESLSSLLRLYYLYNKSSKNLRSLEDLITELGGLIERHDSYIEDQVVAPMKACGTRWIGHLVNALQRAINKFGVYLNDLEKMANDKATQKAVSSRSCVCT